MLPARPKGPTMRLLLALPLTLVLCQCCGPTPVAFLLARGDTGPAAVILIGLMVGAVFLSEGISAGSNGSCSSPASISPYRWASDLPPPFSLRCRFCRILLHTQLHNALDQVEGHRLIEWKPEIALRPSVACDCLLQGFVTGNRRIQPEVLFPCCEVDQNPLLPEGGH